MSDPREGGCAAEALGHSISPAPAISGGRGSIVQPDRAICVKIGFNHGAAGRGGRFEAREYALPRGIQCKAA